MIVSMTGYGRGVYARDEFEVTVEIRSVNNRFFDLVLKAPRSLGNYEQQIRELIGKYVKRGRVNVWIGVVCESKENQKIKLNDSLLLAYVNASKDIKTQYDVSGSLDINQLLALPDILEMDEEDEASGLLWECVANAITAALLSLVDMRKKEGTELEKDFLNRINSLNSLISQIEELAKDSPAEHLEKLKGRISRIVTNEPVDDGRLEMEMALVADRLDVTEECVRFHSHNKLFLGMLNAKESQGRKLNFLLQEMNREANTIGVKAASAEVSHLIVQIKEEVERVREQIQNIE
jgi:uncharacterized protein (TIGR00255 family)